MSGQRRSWLVLCGAVALFGCGHGSSDAATTAGSDTPAVTAASSAPSTTSADATTDTPTSAPSVAALWDPASLPPCAGLTNFTSPPQWLPTSVPDGLALGVASSDLSTDTSPQDPTSSPPAARTEFTLVERTPTGELRSAFTVDRRGDARTRWVYDTPDGPSIDTVRGQPGTIVKLVNRGDGDGHIEADWVEHGVQWTASAQNVVTPPESTPTWTVDDLAAALAPLELSEHTVVDPTGRFVVVGQQPVEFVAQRRRTIIDLSPDGTEDGVVAVGIQIEPRGQGASGVTGLAHVPLGPGATLVEADGRAVASSPLTASVELPDGSIATATANGGFEVVAGELRPSWTRPIQDELRDLVLGIVAVDPSDARLTTVPMPETGGPICRED